MASTHTDQGGNTVIGSCIDSATLAQVRALAHEQDYCVTPFVPTPLYGDRPTYIYHAAIRDPDDDTRVVGGIGIVFDSEPELFAMLRGGLGNKVGTQALFMDRQGRVISSTDPRRPAGTTLELDPALLALPRGSTASRIVIHDGHYAILGCAASSGYREFKVSDGYCEDVLAVVFQTFGEVRERVGAGHKRDIVMKSDLTERGGQEFATFLIDGALFALPAEQVLEARSASKLSPVPRGDNKARIGMLGLEGDGTSHGTVWVFDLGHLLRGVPSVIDKSSQVIMVRHGEQSIGLLVNALHGVPEFSEDQIMPSPFAGPGPGALVTHFIKANRGSLLIQVIHVGNLFSALLHRDPAAQAG